MTATDNVTLFHAPQSRSAGTLALLEELGAPFELHALNLKAGDQRAPAYLAVNPMGKVPAIRHGDAVITEQVAIVLYLADTFPEAGLAPAIGDPLRGPYLRWMAFYAACYEPALVDKMMKHEPAMQSTCPYGDFETMLGTLKDQLAKGPYILGERFSAADVHWGGALRWGRMFDLVPADPIIDDYVQRITSRPAFDRAAARDAELVAEQQKALEGA
ncbi:MAG TPA: glutathione S-transferase family protein [Caulobacteraceae bacterium]|jgi:glutathione S-transferase|nr:glutathione S-transferase family protein [Caulobacteraceae bacterium]